MYLLFSVSQEFSRAMDVELLNKITSQHLKLFTAAKKYALAFVIIKIIASCDDNEG